MQSTLPCFLYLHARAMRPYDAFTRADSCVCQGCLTVSIATYLYLSTGPEKKAAVRSPAKDEAELLPLNKDSNLEARTRFIL